MNPIKIISIAVLILSLFTACSKDDYKLNSDNVDPFVRFNVLVSSNNLPLQYPAVNSALVPVSSYKNTSVKTLKIPVTLTSPTLKKPVFVTYSITGTGDSNSFSVKPLEQISFMGNQLTDTIYLSFDKRWSTKQKITLKLEESSDPAITIGNLNTVAPNNSFEVNLDEVKTTYTFPINRFEIKGEIGEEIVFKVDFPNGFIPSEINDNTMFEFLNGFNYSLTHDDFGDNRNSVTYRLTLLENIKNDDVFYQTNIALVNSDTYKTTGNTVLQIVKPIKSIRDTAANTAGKFYDLSNPFYLTYGENWFDRSGVCAWQTFNAFTFPVVVPAGSENAILYSDKGTSSTTDDVYHHAFKIGFNVTTGTNTTNSFGLKRWFSNESISAANSPGFNITSALEFFPENGNSKTKGAVLVIPQYITIAGTNGKSYSIGISGGGTYKEISAGLFEISFELKATNTALFGGTVSSQYRIFNNRVYPKPTPISESCLKEISL